MKRDKFGRFCSSTTVVSDNSTVLILRTCNKNLQGYGGFQWPASGPVSCLDWNPKPVCGGGLHGLLNGVGDGGLLNWSDDAVWLVVEVIASEVVSINDQKVKFPRGTVVFCGNRKDATDYIWERNHLPSGEGPAVVGASRIVGDKQTVIVGYCGTASAGYRGTASAGGRGTASVGNGGTASAGDGGTASAGYRGTASAGYDGTASAGNGGTASAGDYGTASAGDNGTASAGYRGTASAGKCGTASVGNGGTASAGDRGTASTGYDGTASAGNGGTISIKWWDAVNHRYRTTIGYVGENGIVANKKYKCSSIGQLVKVK